MANRFASDPGASLLTIGAAVGVVVAGFAYFDRASGIDGTPGALLVVASSLALCLAGIAVVAFAMRGGWLHAILTILLLLGIFGTGLAAWMLHSYLLLAIMGLCLIGWLIHMFTGALRRRSAAPQGASQ